MKSDLCEMVQELRVLESLKFGEFFQARWYLKAAIRQEFMDECMPSVHLLKMRGGAK